MSRRTRSGPLSCNLLKEEDSETFKLDVRS